jgi:hypothetical protein
MTRIFVKPAIDKSAPQVKGPTRRAMKVRKPIGGVPAAEGEWQNLDSYWQRRINDKRRRSGRRRRRNPNAGRAGRHAGRERLSSGTKSK